MPEQKKQAIRCWVGVLVGLNILSQLCGSTAGYAQVKLAATFASART
jgi:hypothetical protein